MNEETIQFMGGIEIHVRSSDANRPAACEPGWLEAKRSQIVDERREAAARLDESRTDHLNHHAPDNTSLQVFRIPFPLTVRGRSVETTRSSIAPLRRLRDIAGPRAPM